MKKYKWDLSPVKVLKKKIWLSKDILEKVKQDREVVKNIISWKDSRKILIIWPCSSDFPDSLVKYAKELKKMADKVSDKIFVIMRFYTWKPRTIWGWKWLQNSLPGEKANIRKWLENIREIWKELLEIWLPLADEILHPQISVYYEDMLSYAAIWARTTLNQFHREFSSGADYAIWFKNLTDGDVKTAVEWVLASNNKSQYILGSHIYDTEWNDFAHWNLRWWNKWPNYFAEDMIEYLDYAKENNNNTWFIIDCNHANSWKKHLEQINILENVLTTELKKVEEKYSNAKDLIKWFMVESYLKDWRQDWSENIEHWLSLTDPCIWLDNTEKLVKKMYELL